MDAELLEQKFESWLEVIEFAPVSCRECAFVHDMARVVIKHCFEQDIKPVKLKENFNRVFQRCASGPRVPGLSSSVVLKECTHPMFKHKEDVLEEIIR